MTTATVPRKPVKLDRKQVTDAYAELRKAIVTGTDEHLVAYLSDMARMAANGRRIGLFRRWSHRNHMMLAAQRRQFGEQHIGLYAGAKQWARFERSVRVDARPKVIWAYSAVPVFAAVEDDGTQDADRKVVGHRPGFQLVDVFDWSDTVADDPDFVEPNWCLPLAVGDAATRDALAASSPVPVRFVDVGSRNENGWLDATGITVDSSRPVGNQIATISHELGHLELGHLERLADTQHSANPDEVRAECEQEAELTQWLVLKMLGLDEEAGNDLTAKTANYLRTWIDPNTGDDVAGHKRRGKLLDARLDAAMSAAEKIIDRYLAVSQPEDD
jgi:hypothetical protein